MKAMQVRPRGRKRKYAEYEELLQGLPKVMTKRPKYVNAIGVFRGSRGETAWVKISLPHGAAFKGKSYQPGSSLEIKLGSLSSWTWQQLEDKFRLLTEPVIPSSRQEEIIAEVRSLERLDALRELAGLTAE